MFFFHLWCEDVFTNLFLNQNNYITSPEAKCFRSLNVATCWTQKPRHPPSIQNHRTTPVWHKKAILPRLEKKHDLWTQSNAQLSFLQNLFGKTRSVLYNRDDGVAPQLETGQLLVWIWLLTCSSWLNHYCTCTNCSSRGAWEVTYFRHVTLRLWSEEFQRWLRTVRWYRDKVSAGMRQILCNYTSSNLWYIFPPQGFKHPVLRLRKHQMKWLIMSECTWDIIFYESVLIILFKVTIPSWPCWLFGHCQKQKSYSMTAITVNWSR